MKKWLLLLLLIGLTLAPAMRSSSAVDGLHPFGRGAWQEIRKAHAGQPLVVHFWGVTCGPCRTEMPQWGKFLYSLSTPTSALNWHSSTLRS
jgi:thiol-disulfide isomerase/thioredoxin